MAFNLFGFKFGKADSPPEKLQQKEITPNKGMVSFVVPQSDDGSIPIEAAGGFFGQYIDLDGTVRNDWELITRYREMAAHPEIEAAIDDILGEAIVHDENDQPIKVVLDNAEGIGETTKKKIAEEFDSILKLLKFQEKGYDIFRHWYVDSRLAFHIMIDESKKTEGIKELRYIDPINLQKIKKYIKKPTETGVEVITGVEEFFVYHKDGFRGNNTQGIKINPDAIAFLTSGLFDTRNKRIVGYLHKAIKPLNLLKMMEDAIVIYRITRSPERRVFYVDTGNLPAQKAEQYVKDLMNRHRNKLVYDSSTGEVRDDKRHMAMIEDYWLPRKEGGKGTEIDTLPSGQNLSEIEDVKYFQKKLYKSLNVPITRLESEQKSFSIGKSTEITRDEVKFSKFITRLRTKFSDILYQLLRTQLILKEVVDADEWEKIKDSIYFDFLKDSYFSEMKTSEVIEKKMQTVTSIQPYIGMYYSKQWVKKNILRLNDEEIAQIDCEIEEERKEQELNMLRDAGMNADGSLPMDGGMMPPAAGGAPMGPPGSPAIPPGGTTPDAAAGGSPQGQQPVDMSVLDNPATKKKKPGGGAPSVKTEEFAKYYPRL